MQDLIIIIACSTSLPLNHKNRGLEICKEIILTPMFTLCRWAGFENKSFTQKTFQMFSVHTTPEEFKNGTIAGYFGFAFEELGQSYHKIIATPSFVNSSGVFKLHWFEERL